jgi:hypothetical protein
MRHRSEEDFPREGSSGSHHSPSGDISMTDNREESKDDLQDASPEIQPNPDAFNIPNLRKEVIT